VNPLYNDEIDEEKVEDIQVKTVFEEKGIQDNQKP